MERMALEVRIPPRQSLYQSVLNWLVERIRSGDYPPASRLPSVEQLASSLGVSRSSVREALRVLEAGGVLSIKHGHGIFVEAAMAGIVRPTDLAIQSADDMLQVIHVRRLIEGETVHLAAGLRTDVDLESIRTALTQMMAPGISPADAAKYDLAFHLAIAKSSKNNILTSILHALMGSLYEAILLALADESDKTRAIVEHEQILNAIESQLAERARRLMVEHFRIVEQKVRSGVVPAPRREATIVHVAPARQGPARTSQGKT